LTRLRRYRGRRVPISCFARPDSFSTVPRALCAFLMFCAPGLVFGVTEGDVSRFLVLRAQTHFRRCRGRPIQFSCFRRYRGRRVPFSYFALLNSFSAVPSVSCLVFKFCDSRLVFGGAACVGSRFYVLLSRTRFRRYRVRRVPVFMFCSPELVFGSTESVRSHLHVICSRTHFRPCRVCRVPFSCFALPDLFSAVLRASCPFFMFCASELVFDGNDGVGSCFHVLRSRTRFRRYRGRQVLFSCFAILKSSSEVPRASSLVFMIRAPGLIFGGAEVVGSCFHVLRS
jgi:hypothetical protein